MKTNYKHTKNSNHQSVHEEIAVCAYLIWEQQNCPEGNDVTHWLQAESELQHTTGAPTKR